MQKLAEICIKRPVFAAMIILALVVVGASSYFKLGVDRFPSIDVPTIRVMASLPGAAPEEMETSVVKVIEDAVNRVEGIETMRAVARNGTSFVMLNFDMSRDIDVAAQDVRDRIQGITRELPAGMDPPSVSKSDNDSFPIITAAISGNRSQRELAEIADKRIKVELERANGVGEVFVNGGPNRAINSTVMVRSPRERVRVGSSDGSSALNGMVPSVFTGCSPAPMHVLCTSCSANSASPGSRPRAQRSGKHTSSSVRRF